MTINTIDRAAINRRNAQKSTGPRTSEGKNRSRFNALKHGMTARTLVLPDEDANVLQFRLESWTADLQPQNDVEQYLVEQAVHFSWRLDRAGRAEVARLSHIIESVPTEEANRQREEAAALGRLLFSDRDVHRDARLNREILNAFLPGRKSQSASKHLDVLDHPEAIVLRLESTPVGCQWLLDRWIELHDILDQVGTWNTAEKARAIRLLGKPPLKLTPQEWENHCERRGANPCPEIDARVGRQLDRQLDDRLDGSESATLATLRSVTDQAIVRLQTLAAGHRQRLEAEAARQADILSFDSSTEGERLRRYQFSCSRSMFRSLDTLIKVRRSGLGVPGGERSKGSEEGLLSPVESEPVIDLVPSLPGEKCGPGCSSDPTTVTARSVETEHTHTGAWAPGFATIENETATDPPIPREAPSAPPVDCRNPQDEPTDPPVAVARSPRPIRRAVASALALVLLLGAAVGSYCHSQGEPADSPVDQRNRQNEAIAEPRRKAGDTPSASASILATRRDGGLLVSASDAPMTATDSPSAVLRVLTEPSVSNATLARYPEMDSIGRSPRTPWNPRDVRTSSGIPND